MTEALHTQPLSSDELSSIVTEMQAADPTADAPGSYNDPNHPGSLSYTSYGQVNRAIHRVDVPLTESVGEGNHVLTEEAFKALLADTKDVERLAYESINDLEQAVGDHDTLVRTVNAYERWQENDTGDASTPFEAPDSEELSAEDMARPIMLSDMITYLDAKEQEFVGRLQGRGRGDNDSVTAKYRSSTRLVKDLVSQWHYGTPEARQAREDGREPGITLEFGNEHYDSMVKTVRTSHEKHTVLTQGRIRKLGNEALDAAGIRLRRQGGGTEVAEAQYQSAAPQMEASQTDGHPEASEETDRASDTAEQAKMAETIAEVVAAASGKTLIETNMFDGQRYMGDETHPDRTTLGIPREIIYAERNKSSDWHDKPDEIVAITELTESGGELKRFRYHFEITHETNAYLRSAYDSKQYSEMTFHEGGGGRIGHLEVTADLPKPMADELERLIRGDPKAEPPIPPNPEIARTLVKQLLHSNHDRGLPQDVQAKIDDERYYPKYDKLPSDWAITMLTGNENARGIEKGYDAQRLSLAA
jgi:hypothetical protein